MQVSLFFLASPVKSLLPKIQYNSWPGIKKNLVLLSEWCPKDFESNQGKNQNFLIFIQIIFGLSLAHLFPSFKLKSSLIRLLRNPFLNLKKKKNKQQDYIFFYCKISHYLYQEKESKQKKQDHEGFTSRYTNWQLITGIIF